MGKKRNVAKKPPLYDDGIVRHGRCVLCKREFRILTKHEVDGVDGVWSCADTEDCCQVTELRATVARSKLTSAKDAVRKAIDDGD